jgi:hypothetical protein
MDDRNVLKKSSLFRIPYRGSTFLHNKRTREWFADRAGGRQGASLTEGIHLLRRGREL